MTTTFSGQISLLLAVGERVLSRSSRVLRLLKGIIRGHNHIFPTEFNLVLCEGNIRTNFIWRQHKDAATLGKIFSKQWKKTQIPCGRGSCNYNKENYHFHSNILVSYPKKKTFRAVRKKIEFKRKERKGRKNKNQGEDTPDRCHGSSPFRVPFVDTVRNLPLKKCNEIENQLAVRSQLTATTQHATPVRHATYFSQNCIYCNSDLEQRKIRYLKLFHCGKPIFSEG